MDKLLGLSKAQMSRISKSLQLVELTVTEPQVSFDNWILFLKEQRTLSSYQVLHIMPPAVHTATITRNAKTLKIISIHVEPDEFPFDLSPLAHCKQLQELYICYEQKSSKLEFSSSHIRISQKCLHVN